jgi:hypothetical protein
MNAFNHLPVAVAIFSRKHIYHHGTLQLFVTKTQFVMQSLFYSPDAGGSFDRISQQGKENGTEVQMFTLCRICSSHFIGAVGWINYSRGSITIDYGVPENPHIPQKLPFTQTLSSPNAQSADHKHYILLVSFVNFHGRKRDTPSHWSLTVVSPMQKSYCALYLLVHCK